jgi:hypothetical protein
LIAIACVTALGIAAHPLHVVGQEILKRPSAALSDAVKRQPNHVAKSTALLGADKDRPASRAEQRKAKIASIKETYEPILKSQMSAAAPPGLFGGLFGGLDTQVIGAWSGSEAECSRYRLLFFEDAEENPTVAWWTQPLSLREGGLIPSLIGEWTIDGDALVMSFHEATIMQPFTDQGVSTKKTDINIELDIAHGDDGKLHLGKRNGDFKLAAAELLEGAREKSFIRCTDPT